MIIVVKIIETNLSLTRKGQIKDHQARIVEAESWDDYVESFQNYDGRTVEFKSLTSMIGNSINKELHLYNLEYDDFHLSCNLSNDMFGTKHLAYLIQ